MKDEQRVYIRGVEGRGDEVKQALINLGGCAVRNYNYDASDCLYYINHNEEIRCTEEKSETGMILMDCYFEIKLPERWKDGDVLYIQKSKAFVVFKRYAYMDENGVNHFDTYFSVDESSLHVCDTQELEGYPNLATPQEIDHFQELLHKHGKEWDAEKKQLVDWKWKPKAGEDYFFISSKLSVEGTSNNVNYFDEARLRCGNCFRTIEEGEAMAEKIKMLLKGG